MYVVIAGGGKIGSHLAEDLLADGHDVAIIEKQEDLAERLAINLPPRVLVIKGDACDEGCQREAGTARTQVFAAVTGDDSDNLVACRVARAIHGVARTVSRVNNPKNERIFAELGIEGISSTSVIARLIKDEVGVGDIHTLASLRRGDLEIVEIRVPREPSGAVGKPVAQLGLPRESILVAVVRDEQVITVRGDTVMQPGDLVIAFTRADQERELKRALTGA